MSWLGMAMGWPLVLLPVHILFLQLIIDPACSVVFESEKEEKDIMQRNPRSLKEQLFGINRLVISSLQGLSILAIVFCVFFLSIYLGKSIDEIRTLTFVTLVFANLMLIITNLSWTDSALTIVRRDNPTLWWVLGGTVLGLFLVLYIPVLRSAFHFSFLHFDDLTLTLSSGIIIIFWFEMLKMWRNRASNNAI